MSLTLPQQSRLLVVIVNYRTPELTIDCLHSLEHEVRALGNTQVVVSDNASGDGSTQAIHDAIEGHGWSRWASLLPLERNGGFSFGNNAAISRALEATDRAPPEFVLLLNSDTVVRPGALGALLDFMESRPDVGIAGSRVEEPDGTPQHSRYRFHSIWTELDSGLRLGLVTRLLKKRTVASPLVRTAHVTDWVVGACMIVRRKVFEDIGLLDPDYFLYFEEADFCLTARRAGWSCWYVPTSCIVHLVGQSSGITDTQEAPIRRPRYWFESRQRYFVKNHGQLYALCADAAWVMGFALWRMRRIVQRKPDTDPPHMLWDFLRYRFFPRKQERALGRKRGLAGKLGLALLALVLSFSLLEAGARIFTRNGSDGMPHFGSIPLLPYRPSAAVIEASLARNSESTYIVRDNELGWTVRPDGESDGEDGQPLYHSNHQGFRAPSEREYSLEPPPGKVRIVTVGDSFTHCDEVHDSQTWQHELESRREDLEVLNLGVPAFGTDQALMRWRRDGRRFRSQLVVLGIWPENMCRNLGLIRYYLVLSESFVSKPMMVPGLRALRVLNSPTMQSDELLAALTQPEAHQLVARDFWYSESEMQPKLYQNSMACRVVGSFYSQLERKRTRARIYSGVEPAGIAITVAIADQFSREVRAAGATPLVLMIPMRELLAEQSGTTPLPLVAALREQGIDVLDLGAAVGREALAHGADTLFTAQGHLSPEGNRLLAKDLERELRPWIEAAKL